MVLTGRLYMELYIDNRILIAIKVEPGLVVHCQFVQKNASKEFVKRYEKNSFLSVNKMAAEEYASPNTMQVIINKDLGLHF